MGGFDGVLHRYSRRRRSVHRRLGNGVLDNLLGDKGPGPVVDGDELSLTVTLQRTQPGRLGAVIPTPDDLDHLTQIIVLAQPGDIRHQVRPGNHHDLADAGSPLKAAQAAHNDGLAANLRQHLIKTHPGGRPGGHHYHGTAGSRFLFPSAKQTHQNILPHIVYYAKRSLPAPLAYRCVNCSARCPHCSPPSHRAGSGPRPAQR